MKKKLSKRIIVEEGKGFYTIKLKPSRNLIMIFFQLLVTFFCGYLLIEGIKIFLIKLDELDIPVLLFSTVFILLTLGGFIRGIRNLYDLVLGEETIKIDEEYLSISKNGITRKRYFKIRRKEIQELKIENEFEMGELDFLPGFLRWSNYIVLCRERKLRFFYRGDYKDLVLLMEYFK